MATYPTLPTSDDSRAEPIESRIPVRASNGALKIRVMHPTEKKRFNLVHYLSKSEYDSLESHYGTDKASTFTFNWRGSENGTHTVAYAARPKYEQNGQMYMAYVTLEEV